MTVSSSTNRVSYAGNGSTTVFPYTYKIFDQDDLTVILRAANGTETVQTITSQYTVSGVGNAGGGNVTMLTAPASGTTLVILREQDLVQELDIVPNDPFPADSLEGALDKLTFMVQQHEETLGRTIKASRTNTISSTEFTISAADRANKIFGFDAAGDLSITQELGTNRGDWAASTAYNQRDIVKDGGNDNLYFCNTSHTSSGSLPISSNTDAAKWDLLLDVSAFTTLYDQFDDRYLGAKNSDPATDNDGNTLIDGALYWNTTDNRLKVYDLGNTVWKFTAPSPAEQGNIDALGPIAADVSAVAAIDSDVTTVAGIDANVTTVAGISANVTTVAGISSDVTTVAADGTDIGTVATNIADVNTVAGISGNVTTVAGISADVTTVAADGTDIGTVATNIANVNTVAGISGNVTTVAGISADVTAVAGDATDIGTVSANIANVNTVAGISANVTTVAADGTDIGTVATNIANVNTVAGISGNVTTVAGVSADVTTTATNIAAVIAAPAEASAAAASASAASVSETNALAHRNDAQSARDQSQAARDTAEDHKLAAEAAATSATNTAASLTGFDLDAIAESKAVTAVDVFVYDTSRDSDGGAWRKRTQHTSWYNETLNTATRGARREFPAVAVIVAESNKVTIYDGDDPALPMWMVFETSADNDMLYGVFSASLTSVVMHNAVLANGANPYALNVIDFLQDTGRYVNSSGLGSYLYKGSISERNDNKDIFQDGYYSGIVNNAVNDVAMTVLPDAPIDPATGLPVPTIAVATDGGVSVIKDDGTVVDITGGLTPAGQNVYFDNKNNLYLMQRTGSSFAHLYVVDNLPSADTTAELVSVERYNTFPYGTAGVLDLSILGSGDNSKLAKIAAQDSQFFFAPPGTTKGFGQVQRKIGTAAEGLFAQATSTYNTGWMNGRHQGCLPV
jgi:hypothetical protein